jgi:hypothetical protein
VIATAQDQPRADDRALAQSMNAAWFAFAANPRGPGAPWVAYEKGGKVLEWKGGAPSGADLDALANCSALWLKTAPYRSAATR